MAVDRSGRPGRRVPRSYDDGGSGEHPVSRSTLPGVPAGELLENVVRDVLRAGENTGFQGVVDVQLDLHNTAVDSNGFIVSLFSGSDSKTSTVSIKLATRVHLGDEIKQEVGQDT
jgi:hypothetical protein